MKITVRESVGKANVLILPARPALCMFFKRCGSVGCLSGDMRAIVKAIKAAKKQWGRLKIAEIRTADGEEITIEL